MKISEVILKTTGPNIGHTCSTRFDVFPMPIPNMSIIPMNYDVLFYFLAKIKAFFCEKMKVMIALDSQLQGKNKVLTLIAT